MTRSVGFLLVLLGGVLYVLAIGAPAWAQAADPLRPASVGAVVPYYNITTGDLFFLVLASPVGDNGFLNPRPTGAASHLYFYSADCRVTDDIPVPMSQNDVEVVQVLPTIATEAEGAILIAGTTDFVDPLPLQSPVVAYGIWVDVKADAIRIIEPAAATVNRDDGQSWSPYDTASILPFAPADDGASARVSVLFSCPLGTTPRHLAADMDGLGADFSSNTVSAVQLRAVVFDLDEQPLADWTLECRCVGTRPSLAGAPWKSLRRLSAISPLYAVNKTYTEIRSDQLFGDQRPRHLGYVDMQIWDFPHAIGGPKKNHVRDHVFRRLNPADADEIFGN